MTMETKALVEVGLEALDKIAEIADKATSGTAPSAITLIRVIVKLVEEMREGKRDPIDARNEIRLLADSILDNDKKADESLAKKFPSVE